MFEAGNELYKIIANIETRLKKMKELKVEMRLESPNPGPLVSIYASLLKMSSRILMEIRVLKSLERTMDRPFMFSSVQYDNDHMHLQMKRKRCQILNLCPQLQNSTEMQKFMMPEGEMADARRLETEITELAADEALWSSDDEDDESEMAGSNDFEDFNRQLDNESSVAFESSFGGKSKRTVSISPQKR